MKGNKKLLKELDEMSKLLADYKRLKAVWGTLGQSGWRKRYLNKINPKKDTLTKSIKNDNIQYMDSEFPIYKTHKDVRCFHCYEDLKDAKWTATGNASGKYKKFCPTCTYRTYYDIMEKP
jgi:hypothetical protein